MTALYPALSVCDMHGSCGAECNYKGYCNPEIEAVYGCSCCSRGLTSSKSSMPFQ
jgi:hypothetical protein